jgi:hypothetical protein
MVPLEPIKAITSQLQTTTRSLTVLELLVGKAQIIKQLLFAIGIANQKVINAVGVGIGDGRELELAVGRCWPLGELFGQ